MKTYNCEIEAPSKQFFVFIMNIDYPKDASLTKTFQFLFSRVIYSFVTIVSNRTKF